MQGEKRIIAWKCYEVMSLKEINLVLFGMLLLHLYFPLTQAIPYILLNQCRVVCLAH